MQKKFITEVKAGITPETWLPRDKGGDNKVARYELKDIFRRMSLILKSFRNYLCIYQRLPGYQVMQLFWTSSPAPLPLPMP